jgi:hypothetical protein
LDKQMHNAEKTLMYVSSNTDFLLPTAYCLLLTAFRCAMIGVHAVDN